MGDHQTGKCKGCGAPILWAQTQDEKFHPLNTQATVRYYKDHRERWQTVAFYQSHFETCPQGPRFKKKGAKNDGTTEKSEGARDQSGDRGGASPQPKNS